jgi:adenylate cyclase
LPLGAGEPADLLQCPRLARPISVPTILEDEFMSGAQRFRIKNAMLFANLISNAIGVVVVMFLASSSPPGASEELLEPIHRTNLWFLPGSMLLPIVLTLVYERPIRRHVEGILGKTAVDPGADMAARRRLLNEPFYLILLDFSIWVAAAIIYSVVAKNAGAGHEIIRSVLTRSLLTGLITVTVAFFVFEFVLQRRVMPYLFPGGRLSMVPGALRVRIGTRLLALLFACNLVPFVATLRSLHEQRLTNPEHGAVLSDSGRGILIQTAIFMGVGIWLTFLVSSNLTRPLGEIIQVLRRVRRGDFDAKVRVTTNDEIGYTGDVINEMTQGLRERELIKETFGKYVTEEVRDEILSGRVPLDGELREVTVIFSDLRDFTPMVERLPPKEVVKILNQYFREMEEAIRGQGGLVLQYIRDEIEAVFGAPVRLEDHPRRAVDAAQEMTRRLRTLNNSLTEQGYPTLSHGIGIHTGEVVAANIGSPDRLSYTLVGDTVNLASRLQDLNKDMGTEVILSGATKARLGAPLALTPLPPQMVKGRSQSVDVYTLVAG